MAVSAGSHQVSELAHTGTDINDYEAVFGGDCAADGMVTLAAGESKTVEFLITPDKLSFLDLNLKSVVEPGWFDIMVGTSSVKYETAKLEVVAK